MTDSHAHSSHEHHGHDHTHEHGHHDHETPVGAAHGSCCAPSAMEGESSSARLAASATLHCLLGCGLGEILGMIISTALGMGNVPSIVLAVFLGFVLGFALGVRPLLKAGLAFRPAMGQVLATEGLSIGVMEGAEVLAEVYTPGVMMAGLMDGIFWIGMGVALVAGFVAAFPVNFMLVRRGVRHQH